MIATHPYAGYWDHGVDFVQRMTGAADSIMDGSDIRGVCADLGISLPCHNVLDVGCGTGRVASLCDVYYGVDIAPSAVAYCTGRGVRAMLIGGAHDLPEGPFDWVWACSMFTHIGRDEQRDYLAAFRSRAQRFLIDILPGDQGNGIERWGTDETQFVMDATEAGYSVSSQTTDRVDVGGGGALHRYYVGERR